MTDGIKRRDFLKVLGVSGAGATLTGCSTGDVERRAVGHPSMLSRPARPTRANMAG